MKKNFKIVFVSILVILVILGVCSNFCYADVMVPDDFIEEYEVEVTDNKPKLISDMTNSIEIADHKPETSAVNTFNYTPIIIGIVAAIVVSIAIIILVSGNKEVNKDENKGE